MINVWLFLFLNLFYIINKLDELILNVRLIYSAYHVNP